MAEHVVVIGAGVYGAAVADALTRRGARVTVVDASEPASGTSGATFSWTNSCGKQPRVYHDLNVAGMAAHRELATEAPSGDWYHETGNLEWTDDAGLPRLRAKVASLLDYGYDARWLSGVEALRLEPGADPSVLPADEIAYFPREGWIDPVRLVDHLLSGAVSRGTEVVRRDAVTALDVSDGLVRAVRLASGRHLTADAVVNCAGPNAAQIAELAGLTLPMRNSRGAVVRVAPVEAAVARVVHAPSVHLRPDGDNWLLLHSDELDASVQVSDTPDQSTVDEMLDACRELYPETRTAQVERVLVGNRPIPDDGLPVLGRAAALPNFHFAVSHSGATLCVHVGRLVAAEVLGENQDDALTPFRFERLRPTGGSG